MINLQAGVLQADNFCEEYFNLHREIYRNADLEESRNGITRELLNFKTIIDNPIKRCVGGYNRNINIFFLMAESLWIWAGKRDVQFLEIFNSKIKDYSDDGKFFHAPYGWRLRKYGVDSMIEKLEENNHYFDSGIDQIELAIKMLSENPQDRRVVCSIWNAEFDLNKKSLDLPCNDLLMFKIRKGKLFLTIQNRSNDLDWGLTTNVFQFSVIGEIMSKILDVELGQQVHNSQSLHLYLQLSNLTETLENNIENSTFSKNIYEVASKMEMDLNFLGLSVEDRLCKIDFFINSIILKISSFNKDFSGVDYEFEEKLLSFSKHLFVQYKLLSLYVFYKNKIIGKGECVREILSIAEKNRCVNSDIIILSLNFFMIRLKESKILSEKTEFIHLIEVCKSYGINKYEYIGRL